MIKIIHTLKGLATTEFVSGMTLADGINDVGFDMPDSDTAVKARRNGARIELRADEPLQDGDVISLAKSADGGIISLPKSADGGIFRTVLSWFSK